jgi:UDP-N-acetylmuramoylalanine--D-glutamate ligase
VSAKKAKKTLVVGLGTSGFAAAAFLARRGQAVVATDHADTPELRLRAETLRALEVEVLLGVEDLPTAVDQVVSSPGIPPERLEVFREKKIPVLGEIEVGCQEIQAPIVAVTGTNGKSTVVTNLAKGFNEAGRKAVALGNLGTPVTEWVDRREEADVVVLEVSSYQLETIVDFHPKAAVILNLAPDHLGHHGSMEAYVAAKGRITLNQTIDDVLILHKDLAVYPQIQKTRGKLYWYGRDLPAAFDGLSLAGSCLSWRGGGPEWTREAAIGEVFPHDVDNLLACAAVLHLMGIEVDQILRLFQSPARLPHRLEVAGTVGGVRYLDDSKATNAHAAIAALRAVEGPVLWLAGGEGKGEDLSDLVSTAKEKAISLVICFGRDREIFHQALAGEAQVEVRTTLREAFDLATEKARPGETVLLSPACASFDEFKSFEDRGNQFKEWVAGLEGRRS